MKSAITRRSGRKSEPRLNEMEGINLSPPVLEYNQASKVVIDHEDLLYKGGSAWDSRSQHHQWIRSISPITHSLFSFLQLLIRRDIRLSQLRAYLNKKSPIHVGIVLISLCASFSWFIIHFTTKLLGPQGSIKGGDLGSLVDQYARDYTRYRTMAKWRKEVRQELHIPISFDEQDGTLLEPKFWPFDTIIDTRPNAAAVEMLLREKRRLQKLYGMLQSADAFHKTCTRNPNTIASIPKTILLLESSQMKRNYLLPYWMTRSEFFDIDSVKIQEADIASLSYDVKLKSCRTFVSNLRKYALSTSLELYCMTFNLGGMQLSDKITRKFRPDVEKVLSTLQPHYMQKRSLDSNFNLCGGHCNNRLGYAILSNTLIPEAELRKGSSIASHISTMYTAFPPEHPAFLCLPPLHSSIGISPYDEANQELNSQSVFLNKLQATLSHGIGNLTSNKSKSIWGLATLPCSFDNVHNKHEMSWTCCNQVSISILDSFDDSKVKSLLKDKVGHHLIFTITDLVDSEVESYQSFTPMTVIIKEDELSTQTDTVRQPKESLQESLKHCEPGWFCNRCLQSSLFGSFRKCSSVCKKCAVDTICNGDVMLMKRKAKVLVEVNQTGIQRDVDHRIPRIIHQTWFENVTLQNYPQLFRLQNTWKSSGWDYRFYTDSSAREYIKSNYPERFLNVFDSLLPGAYKADFFRYLVLYKDGGIYADIDVMLNVNLDFFVTSNLAFFAPIDAVGSYADEQFCIWNGFLGSAPAHPILTHVIEWMLNLVYSRGDMYDMEGAVCNFIGDMEKMENWKVRAEPSLMLSGPCALGIALNNALGNDVLSKFRSGLITRNEFNKRKKNFKTLQNDLIGDVMILVSDKHDLGAFRFSDPERNIIVATTDLASLSKSPMRYEPLHGAGIRKMSVRSDLPPHYSISTKGHQLWGTHDVYADDFVTDEHVTLMLSHI